MQPNRVPIAPNLSALALGVATVICAGDGLYKFFYGDEWSFWSKWDDKVKLAKNRYWMNRAYLQFLKDHEEHATHIERSRTSYDMIPFSMIGGGLLGTFAGYQIKQNNPQQLSLSMKQAMGYFGLCGVLICGYQVPLLYARMSSKVDRDRARKQLTEYLKQQYEAEILKSSASQQ